MKIRNLFQLFCIVFSTLPVFAQEAGPFSTIEVPKGSSIRIDGKLNQDEWKDALTQKLKGGGSVKLIHDGEFLQIGLQGGDPRLNRDVLEHEGSGTFHMREVGGLSHIYLTDGSYIYVLHASASLGIAVYQRKGDLWQPIQEFKWDLKGESPESENTKVYLSNNGWLANVAPALKAEREYKISMKFGKSEGYRLAVVYATNPFAPQVFPVDLADDTLKMDLLFGNEPTNLRFNTERWALLKLKAK